MDVLTGIALAAPAGLNAYIPLLAVAVADRLGWIALESPYSLLSEWWMIGILVGLLLVEFVADKVPAVDTANDAIQTVVRPAAGGLLAVSASGAAEVPPSVLMIVGVLLAGAIHAAKAASRPIVNTTTGGAGAPVMSVAEDVVSAVVSFVALAAPVLAVMVIAGGIALSVVAFTRMRKRRRGH